MRNLKLLTLMLFIGLFIGDNGCRKDEVGQLHDLSPLVNSRTTFDSNQSDNDYLSKRPFINDCYNQLPSETWSKEAILSSLGLYSDLLCTFSDEMTKIGNPLWSATIFDLENQSTLTPIIGSENSVKGMFNVKYTSDTVYYMVYDGSLYFNEEDNKVIKYLDDVIFERRDGGICDKMFKDKGILHYRDPWYVRLFPWDGDAGYSGGFIRTGGGSGGPSGPGGGGYSGGGSSGSTGYLNPKGRYYACDTRLTTVKGCEDFFKNSMGYTHLDLASDPYFQEKLETCGCWYAVRGDNDNWSSMSHGEKCMSCMPTNNYSYETELRMKVLVDFLKTIKTGCNSSQELLDEINSDLHEKACRALLPPYRGISPLAEINNIIKRLEDNNIDFTSIMTHQIFNSVKTIGPSSNNVEEIIQKFNLTADDMTNMSEDELCKKLQINQCLKSSFLKLNDDNTLHPEEKKVLDWYNNTSLIDPCSGEDINKDDILLQACAEGAGVSMIAIDEALEGKDAILPHPNLSTLCPTVNCLFNKIINKQMGSNFVCNLKSQFDGSTGTNNGKGFHLHIRAEDFTKSSNLKNDGLAITTLISGRPTILINSSNCNQNNNLFNIFDTFQHEMIHANILQNLLNNGWSGAETDRASAFHAYVLQEYGPNAGKTEHELMLNSFVKDMVQSLIDANGGIGSYSDFEGLVLNGFGQDILKYTNYTVADIQLKKQNFNNFIANPANITQNFISCP